ncbi:cytochrome c biogenesis protein CcsA [Roseospirillum parvum]|uniref:ABC-type uncharacterized transport system, permease component n=1 Tax=Roseospirillum parvum TaxID=83401 RepID=A0A1G7YAK9_9PROT|nr:cytochrome c biogenesis protein CcsA [Roseospirillum parvum]SDG93387.1 ABC-type uncharacterized transport system, permease component [Roseospirillum parvum]
MDTLLTHSLTAFLGLLPATMVGWVGYVPLRTGNPARAGQDPKTLRVGGWVFWAALAMALLSALSRGSMALLGGWDSELSAALWVSIATSLILYVAGTVVSDAMRRLLPLLMPYLAALALMAILLPGEPQGLVLSVRDNPWVALHILVGVLTYALLTLAAVAAFGAFLQERALKLKRPTRLSRRLPPAAAGESLSFKLLMGSELVLGVGLGTGLALDLLLYDEIRLLDHKTLLSFATFVIIGGVLAAHQWIGVRGRLAARWILLAYLHLTLGYLGVKFVADVLLP